MKFFKQRTLEQIIDLCKKGDNHARKEIYQRFSPYLMSLCYRYMANRQDAEDVLMEGFIKIFGNIDSFKGGSFPAWISTIMRNECLVSLRKQKHAMERQGVFVQNEDQEILINENNRFSTDEIMNALTQLPPAKRTIFNLSVIEGLKHEEICQLLNVEKVTVVTTLYKAKCLLRDYLLEIELKRKKQ